MGRALVLGFLALSLLSSAAFAQKKAGATKAQPSAAGDPVSDSSDEVARGLFQAGKAAFESGNYTDALNYFEQAHTRSRRPQLLYNIGQAADRLRQDAKALEAFREFLKQLPDTTYRAEVESRIAAIERAEEQRKAEVAAAAAAAPPTTTAPTPAETAQQAEVSKTYDDDAMVGAEPSDSEPVTKQWWFWTGIGAVVVGGTAVALALALGGGDAGSEPIYEGNGGSLQGP